jgi:tetratricopeptide (TPR) repeat protein
MTIEERVKLATTARISLDPKEALTCPLPGNITMRKWIREMVERFGKLTESSRDALRAMKLLYSSGNRVTFPRLQTLLFDVFDRDPRQHEPMEILKTLWNEHFLLKQPSAEMLEDCLHFGLLAEAVSYEEGREPRKERWDRLAQAFEKMKDVEALLSLSHNQGRLGDLNLEIQIVNAALRIDNKNAEGHFQRGYALARLRRYDEALEANKRALELRPEFTEALNNRGYILSCLGKLPDAEAALRRALELGPSYDDAHTNLAIVLVRTGRPEEAIQEIRTALGIRQENYYAYLSLGITLSRQDDIDGALKAYDEALRIRHNDYPEALLNRGITLAKNKRWPEALAAFDRAIKLRDNYAEAHMHRGMTLFQLGTLCGGRRSV